MLSPPESFDQWLEKPLCPNCSEAPAEVPDSQQILCSCGTEFVVLVSKFEKAGDPSELFWTMPVAEFFENIDEVWRQLRDTTDE